MIEVFAKLTLVSDLTEAWQSPTETFVDVTGHFAASERVREEVLRALRDFRCRMEQVKLEAVTNGTYLETHTSAKSFV
jgi:phage baseplate assembly protein W